jgi:hypothetical protein
MSMKAYGEWMFAPPIPNLVTRRDQFHTTSLLAAVPIERPPLWSKGQSSWLPNGDVM